MTAARWPWLHTDLTPGIHCPFPGPVNRVGLKRLDRIAGGQGGGSPEANVIASVIPHLQALILTRIS